MGFFVFDAIKSALTPPGTAARNADTRAKAAPQAIAGDLLSQYAPTLRKNLGLLNWAQPYQERAYKDLFALTTPEGVFNRAEGIRGKLMGEARAAAPELRSRFAGTGGIGLQQGMELQGFNEANRQANEYLSYLMSPEGRGELSKLVLQLASSFPGMDLFGSLNQIIQGREAPAVGASPLDAIAKVLGAYSQMKRA